MKRLVFCAVLIAIAFSTTASASYISLTTTMDNIVLSESGSGSARIKISNSGDETAHNVRISLNLPESFTADTIYAGSIAPNSFFEGVFNISKPRTALRGSYAASSVTEYEDANGYAFSSISPNLLIYGDATISRLSGIMKDEKIGEKGTKKIYVRIINTDDVIRNARVTLYLPREIVVKNNGKAVAIDKNSEKTLEFEISNVAALSGSSYVIFADIEYEDRMHYSHIARATLQVAKEDYMIYVFVIILFLVIALVGINIRHRFFG